MFRRRSPLEKRLCRAEEKYEAYHTAYMDLYYTVLEFRRIWRDEAPASMEEARKTVVALVSDQNEVKVHLEYDLNQIKKRYR